MKKLLLLLLCGIAFGISNNQVWTTNGSGQRVWQGPLDSTHGGTGYTSIVTPTVQSLLGTYYVFTITQATPTFVAGETCANNGQTFTVVFPSSASGITTLLATGASNPVLTSSSLTSCSAGSSSLTYSSAAAVGAGGYATFTITTGSPTWSAGTVCTAGGGSKWISLYPSTVSATKFVSILLSGSGSSSPLASCTGGGTSSLAYSGEVTNGTYFTPSGTTWIKVKMVGGGCGGGGGNSGGVGSSGGNTLFGTSLLTANGGTGVIPGFASIATSTTVFGIALSGGGSGSYMNATSGQSLIGGIGGASVFGGAGAAGTPGSAGGNAAINSGGGGGGGGSTSSTSSNYGGPSGGYVDAVITSPSASYQFVIGTGGAGTASAPAGGNGASGMILVEEHYGF